MTTGWMREAALAAVLCLGLTSAALARDPTDTERAGIAARVATFDTQVRAGDLAGIVGVMPPRLKQYMATRFGVPPDQMDQAMMAVMAPLMATVTIEDFKMDLSRANYRLTPDGQRFYALIPTETRMTIQKTTKLQAVSTTLALFDDNGWYLVRLDQPQQVAMFKEAFPEFASIDFPPGEMKPLN